MSKSLKVLLVLTGLLIGLTWPVAAAPPQQGPPRPGNQQLIDQIKQNTQNKVRISYHADTGKVNFIGTDSAHAISQPSLLPADASPEAAARGFLARYGQLFGLRESGDGLSVMKQKTLEDGRSFVRFQQRYQGIPIVGGELIIQATTKHEVISANGEILPDLNLDTTPGITADTAREAALARVAKEYDLDSAELTASAPELWIFNPALLGGPGPRFSVLVWRTEVTPLQLLPIREFVLVDAQRGGVVLNFNQVDMARNRQTRTAGNGTTLPGTLICNEASNPCAGDAHVVAAHKYAGDTYNFYFNQHGRDSLNNAGLPLISTVHYDVNYANAFWNGAQMVYGDAFGFPLADDVVAHELTHGVTQYESNLFYYYQAGAINESLSDVWGEFVDLTNSAGNDSAGARWKVGEDISGLGAIRNMQNPPAFGDPDKLTSANYFTGDLDSGGVHSNSGVNNKAAYLITDGGTFNGQTVTSLGIPKAAKIYYEVQTNLLVSGSDYADLYNVLYQACLNLVGTAGITAGNCQEIRDATNAVQMNQQPIAGFNTDVALCSDGLTPTTLFFDNLESGTGNWNLGALSGTNRWQLDSPYGPFAHSGTHSLYADDFPAAVSNSYAAMKNSVTLPAGAYLHFAHAYGFEGPNYDGSVVEYSSNGGASWTNAGSLFDFNSYDGTIAAGFGNPLGGQSGFLNDSHGYISSRLNLASLAGQSVRFRWRMGLDTSGYDWGWWVDDVRLYTCGSTPPPSKVYLPFIIKADPSSPTGPTPGFWSSNTGDEFYVTATGAKVDNFAIYVSVTPCGTYKITHLLPEPIANNHFSFSGSFYASGIFNSTKTASGTDGLTNFNLVGCGIVNGGPWAWNATWKNSSQPALLTATVVGPESVEPITGATSAYIVTLLK